MVWRNDVRWNIWQEEDPRKFMTVDSGDYVLAVPDFNHYARKATDMVTTQAKGSSSTSSHKYEAQFKKVIMKLSGKVRWQAGLVFEREMLGDKRSFDFEPHYNVTLKNPVHVKSIHNQVKSSVQLLGFMLTGCRIHMMLSEDFEAITSMHQLLS